MIIHLWNYLFSGHQINELRFYDSILLSFKTSPLNACYLFLCRHYFTFLNNIAFTFLIAYTYTPPCHKKTFNYYIHTPGRQQSKTPKLSRNVDKKWLETDFLIAICRHTGNKWQSKTLFISIFDRVRRLLITFSIVALPL